WPGHLPTVMLPTIVCRLCNLALSVLLCEHDRSGLARHRPARAEEAGDPASHLARRARPGPGERPGQPDRRGDLGGRGRLSEDLLQLLPLQGGRAGHRRREDRRRAASADPRAARRGIPHAGPAGRVHRTRPIRAGAREPRTRGGPAAAPAGAPHPDRPTVGAALTVGTHRLRGVRRAVRRRPGRGSATGPARGGHGQRRQGSAPTLGRGRHGLVAAPDRHRVPPVGRRITDRLLRSGGTHTAGGSRMTQDSTAAAPSENMSFNRNVVLAVLVSGAFVTILNQTLLNTALPAFMEDFGITASAAQWVTTIFMLVNGIMIPVTAFLIQKFTTRTLFLTAMALFTVGTLVCALAPVYPVLLAGRVIQAAAGGMIMPLMQTILFAIYSVRERGRAMGTFGLVIAFAPAIGPSLSGWIIDHFPWQTLFYMMLPIAILDIVFAYFVLRNVTERTFPRLDVLSILLSTLGFGGLLFGFSSAGDAGWTSAEVLLSLGIGAVALY